MRPNGFTVFAMGICVFTSWTLARADEAYLARNPNADGKYLMSDKANWYNGAVPSASLSDLTIRFFPYGKRIENDLGEGFQTRGLNFLTGHSGGTIAGNSFGVGLGGICLDNNNPSTVVTTRIETAITSCAIKFPVQVSASDVLYLSGGLTNSQGLASSTWSFIGAGERHIVCDWMQGEVTDGLRHVFSGGTTYIHGHVYLPQIETKGGAHIVVRGKGVLETWNESAYSFIQGSTFDVLDGGKILLGGANCLAQDASLGTATFNVYTNGFLACGSKGYRSANNGHSVINVNGGTAIWRPGATTVAEHGKAEISVSNGGRILVYDMDGNLSEFSAHNNGYRDTITYPEGSTIRLGDGGEFVCYRIASRTAYERYLDVPIRIVFDGGRLTRCQADKDGSLFNLFVFGDKATADRNQLRVHVREAGAVFDCRQNSTRWNDGVPIQGTDIEGGTDGVFEKQGIGKFHLAAPYLSKGVFRVRAGELVVDNPEYFNGKALELCPQAVVSFSGDTLALGSLSVRDGIVRLSSGQTLSVAKMPDIVGQLVFDVPTGVDGTYTLLTGVSGESAAEIAAKCRVLNPTAGKSATFAVSNGNLVLTVADGVAPDAPSMADSEDQRIFSNALADGVVNDEDLDGRSLYLVGDSVRYDGAGAVFSAEKLGVVTDTSITLGADSGDFVFDGTPDLSFVSEAKPPKVSLTSEPGVNKFMFTGDWVCPPVWTSPWFNFEFSKGDYQFGPNMTGNPTIPVRFVQNQSYLFTDAEFAVAPSTDATGATLSKPGYQSAVTLDGAHIKATAGGADFFAGATSLSLGSRGASFDTQGFDVTITQTLLPVGATASAGFEKRGEGTLTMGGMHNVLYGPLAVRGGVLKAVFETGMRKPYPSGAMAIWDFDGDDPYADKSGHGHRLEQSHPDQRLVRFQSENALIGNAAIFDNESCSDAAGGSLLCSDITSTTFATQTISAWVRLASYNVNSGIISTRVEKGFGGAGGTFDLAYKTIWGTNGVTFANGETGFGTIWGGAQATIWNSLVGHAPSLNEWHHIVMVQDAGKYSSYLDGVRYVDSYKGSTTALIRQGCMITIGQGTQASEFMHKGGMIDEVIIYPRALQEEEILQLYEGKALSADIDATVNAGATWNLCDSVQTVRSLSGSGSVVDGTLEVKEGIAVGADHALYVESLAVSGEKGIIDIGYGDEDRIPSDTPVVVMSVGSMDATSLNNLQKWTVAGAGIRNSDRKAEFFLKDGKLMTMLRAKGLMVLIR